MQLQIKQLALQHIKICKTVILLFFNALHHTETGGIALA